MAKLSHGRAMSLLAAEELTVGDQTGGEVAGFRDAFRSSYQRHRPFEV